MSGQRPTETTRIGTTVVYDPPGADSPVGDRPRYYFLGLIPDDAEPGEYAWIADLRYGEPSISVEVTGDLLIVPDETLSRHPG